MWPPSTGSRRIFLVFLVLVGMLLLSAHLPAPGEGLFPLKGWLCHVFFQSSVNFPWEEVVAPHGSRGGKLRLLGGLCLGDLLAYTQIPAAERAPAAPASRPLLPLALRDGFGWRFGSSMAQAPQRLLPQHTYTARAEARPGDKAALLPPHLLLPFPPHFLHIPHAPTKSQLRPIHVVHRRKGTSPVLPLKSPSRARMGNSARTC